MFWRGETSSKQRSKQSSFEKTGQESVAPVVRIQSWMNVDASLNKIEFTEVKLWVEPLHTSWCLEKSLPEYDLADGGAGKGSMQKQLIKRHS